MATVTGVTAERAQQIEDASVVGASIEGSDLILKTHGGTQINVGRISPPPYTAYPVGSVYMTDRSDNPSTYMEGGTWVRWGKGRVPVGVDEAQTEFNQKELVGGAKTHTLSTGEMPSHTHGNAAHNHTGDPHTHSGVAHSHSIDHDHANPTFSIQYETNTTGTGGGVRVTDIENLTGGAGTAVNVPVNIAAYSGSSGSTYAESGPVDSIGWTGYTTAPVTSAAGLNYAHNNLQPYITVYMWKRTA